MTTTPPTKPTGRRTTAGTWLRFLLRLLGLTAALAAAAGGIIASAAITDWTWTGLRAAVTGESGDRLAQIAAALLLGGAAVAAVALAVELIVALGFAAGRRSAAGVNSLVQIVLATALLIGVNVYSFGHYLRLDLTRDKQFTLPPAVVEQLRQLQGETTVVVYQRHKTFGQFSDKPDAYDFAAERKVVEKVNDLIDQFREFGPQFRVIVLDVEEDGFDAKLNREAERVPGLKSAVESAPENSIFFCAGGRVQRLSFNEFYQLDKTASEQANGGRGNLVLLKQGIEPFVSRVMGVEERKPVVGVAVLDELFSTESTNEFLKLTGLRKTLEAYGFEVRDIILRRGFRGPPAAYTFEEDKLDRAEEEARDYDVLIPRWQRRVEDLKKFRSRLETASADEVMSLVRVPAGVRVGPEDVRASMLASIDREVNRLNQDVQDAQEDRRKAEETLRGLRQNERVVEGRRLTDLKEKARRVFNGCDLLIIPRLTLYNIYDPQQPLWIPASEYHLDDLQLAALKEYLKQGKPVLACFGPTNEPGGEADEANPTPPRPDSLELLLSELGIQFGRQTVLYKAEEKAFSDRRARGRPGGVNVDLPPLTFGGGPVGEGMQIVARSAKGRLDVSPRHPRPIAFASTRGPAAFQAEFLFTDRSSWTETNPFPTGTYTPRFDAPKPEDIGKGLPDEEKRGPFPVGVAVQTTVPADWADDRYEAHTAARMLLAAAPTGLGGPLSAAVESFIPADDFAPPSLRRPPIRAAAIGHGGLFVAGELPPAKAALLLTTCNWLLGRDDRLPHANRGVWEYPRVELSERAKPLWHWGTFLGLPALFAYLGLVVLRFRQVR
jgi:hypothetical protein